MIGLADRYVARAVLLATLVVLIAMGLLMTLFALIEELQESIDGYGFLQALRYCLLTLPRRLYEVLPYATFLGALLGLGTLAGHAETVALRAAGRSPAQLFKGVALAVAGFAAAGFALGELAAPQGETRAEVYKRQVEQASTELALAGGYWYREGNLYMNVEGLAADGTLLGVRQFVFDENNFLRQARYARRASFDAERGGWMLTQVRLTDFRDEQLLTVRHDSLFWPGRATPQLLSAGVLLEPRKLSLMDLSFQISYMDREGLGAGRYRLSFWTKVLQPLAMLGLALLALAFVLGPLRLVSIGTRLAVGVLAGLSFKYLQDLFAPMSLVYSLPAWLAVLLPILLCWGVAAWAVRLNR
ncbi:MAG: LPS export ABC transporter permease LptG [Pseudomonadota bacterium]